MTFLFTDIEGSTRLLQRLGASYADVLELHMTEVRKAVEAVGGEEMGTEGDAYFGAFPSAGAAIDAAVAIQRAMSSLETKVRIGIHAGEAARTATGYVGLAVHQAARVCNAGHGGQVLLSQTIRELAPDVEVRDLGTWRLKDIPGEQRLFQLVAPGLEVDFPSLRTAGAAAHNLQPNLSSFVGRGDEIAEVGQLLDRSRLVTLAGAGGSGKTRLAAELAMQRLERHHQGVWWVDLAPLAGDEEVVGAVSAAVGAAGRGNRLGVEVGANSTPPLEELVDFLRLRSCLLVFDNCEHVLDGVAAVVEVVLAACPGVAVLATSREALAIVGETAWRIPSLDRDTAADLFVDRAKLARPEHDLDPDDPSVRSICERLDGMPLAIELAAAKVAVLSVDQIESRLDDRFRLLTGGSRRALPRQQALRAAIDWSYHLLSDQEQAALRRLAVFVGGADLEAVEAVITDEVLPVRDVVDLLGSIVAKSMLLADLGSGLPRYRFLETIRQYAREKLLESDEAEALRDRHAGWALHQAELAEPRLDGLETQAALSELERDYDNLRAALDWFVGLERTEEALRLAICLARVWFLQARTIEGRSLLETALATSGATSDEVRGAALTRASQLATLTNDPDRARSLALEVQDIARRIGDDAMLSDGLFYEAYRRPLDPDLRVLFAEAAELADRTGHQVRRVVGRCYLALNDRYCGRAREAATWADEAVTLARAAGPMWALSYALAVSGRTHTHLGDFEKGHRHCEEGFDVARQTGGIFFELQTANVMAITALDVGDLSRARIMLEEARVASVRVSDVNITALTTAIEARLDNLDGRPSDAEALLVKVSISDLGGEARGLVTLVLGDSARQLGDLERARRRYDEALVEVPRGSGMWHDAADGLVACIVGAGDAASASPLFAAADELRTRNAYAVRPISAAWREGLATAIRAAVGDDEWARDRAVAAEATDDALAQRLLVLSFPRSGGQVS